MSGALTERGMVPCVTSIAKTANSKNTSLKIGLQVSTSTKMVPSVPTTTTNIFWQTYIPERPGDMLVGSAWRTWPAMLEIQQLSAQSASSTEYNGVLQLVATLVLFKTPPPGQPSLRHA